MHESCSAHCPQDEIQIAFLWSREIGGQAGVAKLSSLKMTEKVLIYACENQYPEFASTIIKFAKDVGKEQLKKAHFELGRAYAAQGAFTDAEAHFIQADQPLAAYDMYVGQKLIPDAQRIAARFNIDSRDIRETPKQQQEGTLNIAKDLERQKRYPEAISAYLRVTPAECGGQASYLNLLSRTVKLCARYSQNQLADVVQDVAKVMIDLNEHKALGGILEEIDAYSDAVQVYQLENLWDEAKRISQYLDPEDLRRFNQEYDQHFMASQDPSAIFDSGQHAKALAMWAGQNQWDICLQRAQQVGGNLAQEYTMKYAQICIDQSQFDKAIAVLSKYTPSPCTLR